MPLAGENVLGAIPLAKLLDEVRHNEAPGDVSDLRTSVALLEVRVKLTSYPNTHPPTAC